MNVEPDSIFELLENFIKVSHEFPGMAFIMGLVLGLFTREIIEIAEILNLWLRRLLTGDRRRKRDR